MWIWIKVLALSVLCSLAFALEVGEIEIREQDILIPIKGALTLNLEVLNPPQVYKVGPNTDHVGYSRIYKYAYLTLCYGAAYYRDRRKNVYGVIGKVGDRMVVSTSHLPSKGDFKLLPVRLCACFSDEKLKSIDYLNPGLDNICSPLVPFWYKYTNKRAFEELGLFGRDLKLKVRIKVPNGTYRDITIDLKDIERSIVNSATSEEKR